MTSRRRPAPSAVRMAISFSRTDARTSSRFATFAQAIRTTTPTAASSVSSDGRAPPTICSRSGTTSADSLAFDFGILLRQPLGDRLHLGVGLRHRDTRLQSRDDAEKMGAAGRLGRVERERRPVLGVAREGEAGGITPMIVAGAPLSVIARPRMPRIAAEPPLPHAVAQDDHVVLAGNVFFRRERRGRAPGARAAVRRCPTTPSALMMRSAPLLPTKLRRAAAVPRRCARMTCSARASRGKWPARPRSGRTAARSRGRARARPARERQRPQQHAVDHAEDRAGGADAERQREDGDDGERRGSSSAGARRSARRAGHRPASAALLSVAGFAISTRSARRSTRGRACVRSASQTSRASRSQSPIWRQAWASASCSLAPPASASR